VKIEHIPKKFGYKKGAKEFPLMCVLSFVYICNSKCPNCPYTNSDIRRTYSDTPFMPAEIFKRIADECGTYGCYLRLSGGGEPMLHPQATELMIYAKEKGCRVGLITNGSKFTKEDLLGLIKAEIDVIEFSVDAPDEKTYQKLRPGLNWQTLNRNIELAMNFRNKLGSNTRIIASVVNQEGVDIKKTKIYWKQKIDKLQVRKYLTWGILKNYSQDPTPYLPREKKIPCPWLFERFNIDSRGDVTICGEDIAFKEKFGNVSQYSIKELWHHPKMEYFREMHLNRRGNEIPICSKCSDWQYRSWRYNYWKLIRDAELNRRRI
jgi:radical SAM protein with 4Fe4S-binding SPASM domain